MTAGLVPPGAALETPGLARRLAVFVYEGVLLFGVVMIAGYLYSSLTQQRHALQGHAGLQAFLFVVLAIYFVWFWSHGGQTVAMRAWHVCLVARNGQPVSQGRAMLRYVASWIWFLPALAWAWLTGPHGVAGIFAALAGGVLGYASLALLEPQRQYWHDRWCGTRLVMRRAPAGRAQSAA